MKPEEYHSKEFTEYYASFPEETQSIEEVAEGMWDTLWSCYNDVENPFTLVNYSAGVYAGLHISDDSDTIAVLPDLSNLQYVTDDTDLWAVLERMSNPDAHADAADECVERFAMLMKETRPEGSSVSDIPEEQLAEALFSFMKVACPEYTVVLRVWNPNLSEEQFWEFWEEGHWNAFQGYVR